MAKAALAGRPGGSAEVGQQEIGDQGARDDQAEEAGTAVLVENHADEEFDAAPSGVATMIVNPPRAEMGDLTLAGTATWPRSGQGASEKQRPIRPSALSTAVGSA